MLSIPVTMPDGKRSLEGLSLAIKCSELLTLFLSTFHWLELGAWSYLTISNQECHLIQSTEGERTANMW